MVAELHDAKINQIVVRGSATAVDFSHMCVFVEAGPEKYECWSYRVTIELREVSSITLSGQVRPEDAVADGSIVRADDACEVMWPLDVALSCREFRCVLGSGATMVISARELVIRAIDRIRFLENWDGPLGS